jgi:hypothetical protein
MLLQLYFDHLLIDHCSDCFGSVIGISSSISLARPLFKIKFGSFFGFEHFDYIPLYVILLMFVIVYLYLLMAPKVSENMWKSTGLPELFHMFGR